MNERGLLDLIISRIPELSPRDKISLCEHFNSEEDFVRVGTVAGVESIIERKLTSAWKLDDIRFKAEQDLKTVQIRGINWVSWTHTAYPPLLREIFDPPALLFYRGNLPDPEKPLVAVVGTRQPSPQATGQAYDLCHELGSYGIAVVSGLAMGIDAMAHRGNMEAGSPTFAVLGSGTDEIYPQSNRMLARRILETGGCLISEYPPGTPPYKSNFPARNRIISGMARGVVIVEAPKSSGALITARFAADQNRDLWVASCGATMSEDRHFDRTGSVKLAENGASVIHGAHDILRDWNLEVVKKCDSGISLDNDSSLNNCGRALAEKLARSINL